MSAEDEADREYEERVEGWAERLQRECYLRLGRGTVLHAVSASGGVVYAWRTPGDAGGDADTARDAVAAALHALDVDL